MAEATSDDQRALPTTDDISTSSENFLDQKHLKSPRQRSSNTPSKTAKRRCISTACLACRRRKSKCDGNLPSCAACSSVYGTECIYDPNSDNRRKGVYKKDIDNLKTSNSTLQTLIHAILNYPEYEVPDLIRQIRSCENLNDVAKSIIAKNNTQAEEVEEYDSPFSDDNIQAGTPQFETELSGKMGELRLENGSLSFIGGTSNLLFLRSISDGENVTTSTDVVEQHYSSKDDAIVSWTRVTPDPKLVGHLINMYFTWHYTYFTTLSKSLFNHDFLLGKPVQANSQKTTYCSSLLVNAMLALGCHFSAWPASKAESTNSATAGDHFFKEAKRLIMENGEWENPSLTTVQALALMSVREAGCGREAKGWVYSGMSFRMACDLGLNVDPGSSNRSDHEIDARRITIWGCFLFDKCWSNYLGRQPQLPLSSIAVPKPDVFPGEDADNWSPYTDNGPMPGHSQPSRTRAIALQISALCEISGDLLLYFYHPAHLEKPLGRQEALKKLSELHSRLEAWRRDLPKEMEPKEGQLPNVLVMHMFFQLLFIHLFRPFLKYKDAHSPLPSHLSPRKYCMHAAAMISKLLRLYKRTYGLRHICNIAVYIAHSACSIHLLNLPENNAMREIVQGLKYLEEIAESWLCARRTLGILDTVARRWKIKLPEEAVKILQRTKTKFSEYFDKETKSPKTEPASVVIKKYPDHNRSQHNYSSYVMPHHAFNNSFGQGTSPLPTTPDGQWKGGATSLAPQPAAVPVQDLQQKQQQQQQEHLRYLLPVQPEQLWNTPDQSACSSPLPIHAEASPSILFNGVESLVEESQDWWINDQANLFNNWYGSLEQEAAMSCTSASSSTMSGNSLNGNGTHGNQPTPHDIVVVGDNGTYGGYKYSPVKYDLSNAIL